ncbi:MAG TPA: CocE/NonD family hydrolase, partial [Vicinamibacteria bacterium]|nr:CocE/NonD family hydrolase [Vicinamibacteria bacterium]
RALPPRLLGVRPAVLNVGGWYDAEDPVGPLSVYRAIETSSPGIFNALVMGPWCHGCWSSGDGDRLGNLDFASKTAAYYRESVELPFFAHHLKGAPPPPLPEALVFQTGTNEWRRFDAWPPASVARRTLFLAANGRLSFEPPAEAGEAFDEYPSDPGRPVPFLGRPAPGMPAGYMSEDQRFAATRPDVLVYETGPLPEDVSVAGPIVVTLHVSTTGTDSDFVVKLIDAYPVDHPEPPRPEGAGGRVEPVPMGGYQRLVRGEPFRGKFRRGFEKPAPFEPGKPEAITFTMPDVCHSFRKGHRIMVHVQSSWFPLVDRNPQTFVEIPNAIPADFRKATQRVYRSRERASGLRLLVEGGAR